MNKAELINAISEKTGLTKKDSAAFTEAFFATLTETLANKEEVSVIGFGTFKAKYKPESTARNPRTKETVTVPAKTVPVFKPGKALKEAVNK